MTSPELRRPTDIADVKERMESFRSDEARAAHEAFVARPDDVFICTYSKSGTTWMQQIVHQLRSGGSMDFDDISEVVPWLESAVDVGIDPAADQAWTPRAFKSHLTWSEAPRGGRYITVFRDPQSVLPSYYRFFEGWWFEPGSITLEEFAEGFFFGGTQAGRHWDHIVDWWPHISDPDVLALTYEDMAAAPERVPAVVAEFLGLDVPPEDMSTAVQNSSRAVMNDNASKFDETRLRSYRDSLWGLPPGGDSAKVTRGHTLEMSPHTQSQLASHWAELVESQLGFNDYQAFRDALPDPLGVRG